MKIKSLFLLTLLSSLFYTLSALTGFSVSPPRSYYSGIAGQSTSNKILVTNPSDTHTLEMTVTLNDWKYDAQGSNVIQEPGTLPTSMASWISIRPQSYFSLAPGESREIELVVTPPAGKESSDVPVHTALVYFTQTNPIDSFNESGALVKVSVRTGVKVYHRQPSAPAPDIDFYDFAYNKKAKQLKLGMVNQGNTWTDGTVVTDLVRQDDGTRIKMENVVVYTLPGDRREVVLPLPEKLKPGKYIASSTFTYEGDQELIKVAELTFTHE